MGSIGPRQGGSWVGGAVVSTRQGRSVAAAELVKGFKVWERDKWPLLLGAKQVRTILLFCSGNKAVASVALPYLFFLFMK